MSPECRLDEYSYPIPQFVIEKDRAEGFVEELGKFHGEFSDCFARSEPGKNFFNYMVGQLGIFPEIICLFFITDAIRFKKDDNRIL